jgi:Ca2+/H+ antiporter, TMEM165/GDT1 family
MSLPGRPKGEFRSAKHGACLMSIERVLFAFVIVLALTLNVGFIVGDLHAIADHNVYELFAALVVSLIATVMKFGDRSPLGSTMLATSLVADLQLMAAATAWGLYGAGGALLGDHETATVVSLATGAAVANVVSVVLLIIEMANLRR